MSEQSDHFEITWRAGAYRVSIPNYQGGEVYTAEYVASLRAQLASARKALEAAREHIQGDVDEMSPGWRSAVRLVEQINAALTDEKSTS